nr:putative reverse transcriptase, RNA-dependent DNA polymerase [Tanacetum cinerariifolium]
MFALTVCTAEPKNIKEAMADSVWIEAMQEELHQFDRLQGSNPQDKKTITNIQPTSAPSTPTYVYAEENNDNQAEDEHLLDE